MEPKADLMESVQAAEEEGRAAAEAVRRLEVMGILRRDVYYDSGWYQEWLGFYKQRKDRRGNWVSIFVPVAQISPKSGVVVWHKDVANPAKLLGTLIARYRERCHQARDIVKDL